MSFKEILRKGSKGKPVTELQIYLNKLPEIKPKLVEDGVFGPGTEAAVSYFKKRLRYSLTE